MKFFKKTFLQKDKRAISEIVATLIIILLTISVAAVVFTLAKKTIGEKTKKTDSCNLNLIDKISINSEYTCYDSKNKYFYFSINLEDIEIDELFISIANETDSSEYVLSSEDNGDLKQYKDGGTKIPDKNSGNTYYIEEINERPMQIQIAPKINNNQCEVVDSLNEIPNCSQLTDFPE